MNFESNIKEFLLNHNLNYKDISYYVEACTHSSFSNEQRHVSAIIHNERLEFLGDAILQLCCSKFLFDLIPILPEGSMTRIRSALVREEALDKYADQTGLPKCLRLGRGEEKMGGRRRASLKADAFEAIIGAIYEDLGYTEVQKFLVPILTLEFEAIKENDERDFKSRLQEFIQADDKRTISYDLISSSGPAHAKVFEIAVKLDEIILGTGSATTKKEAEQFAAKQALSILALNND